jgi:hypothetical protein
MEVASELGLSAEQRSDVYYTRVLVAYDFCSKAVHFMAVTSNDEIHDHKRHWQGDQTLQCDPLKGGMGGMPITEDHLHRGPQGAGLPWGGHHAGRPPGDLRAREQVSPRGGGGALARCPRPPGAGNSKPR